MWRFIFKLVLSVLFIPMAMAQSDSLQLITPEVIDVDTLEIADEAVNESKIDSILNYADNFLGVRYGYGSTGTRSFDCSGFVLHVFGKHGVQLPHGSGAQASQCREIKLKKVQPGDLLFFSGRKISKSNVGHVAIVKEVNDKEITMIHATVQSGVIVEQLHKSDYFSKRFIKAGRINQLYASRSKRASDELKDKK